MMRKPKPTTHELVQAGRNGGKLPESFRKRQQEYDRWLKEQKQEKVELSEDLPAREHFIEDGRYTTDEAVQALSAEQLTDVKHIGKSTAEEIIAFYEDQ